MQRISRTLVGVLALSLAVGSMINLGGCAMGAQSIAQEDATTLQKKIVKGKTTKAEIQSMFGEPTDKGLQGGREFWAYRMLQTSFRTYVAFVGGGTEGKDLVINFDKAGVVSSYDLTKSKS